MKKFSALMAAVAAMFTASSASAGGLNDTIIEEKVDVIETKPASSISPLAILAILLVIGLLVSQNDNDNNEG